eukprot:403332661
MAEKIVQTLSKYYDILSLLLLTLGKFIVLIQYLILVRLLFAFCLDVKPVLAPLVFPLITLRLYNPKIKYVSIFIQYTLVNQLIFGDQTLTDLLLILVFCAVVQFEIEQMNKKQWHIFLQIVISNVTLIGIIFALKSQLDIDFTPLGKYTLDDISNNTILPEILYTILFIFLNGPVKVFLEIKEGKTSVKKMMDDYEDERNLLHTKFGLKRPDLLPTDDIRSNANQGPVRRNVQERDSDINDLR